MPEEEKEQLLNTLENTALAYIHARKVGSREDVVESLVRKMGSTITRYTFFKDMEKTK